MEGEERGKARRQGQRERREEESGSPPPSVPPQEDESRGDHRQSRQGEQGGGRRRGAGAQGAGPVRQAGSGEPVQSDDDRQAPQGIRHGTGMLEPETLHEPEEERARRAQRPAAARLLDHRGQQSDGGRRRRRVQDLEREEHPALVPEHGEQRAEPRDHRDEERVGEFGGSPQARLRGKAVREVPGGLRQQDQVDEEIGEGREYGDAHPEPPRRLPPRHRWSSRRSLAGSGISMTRRVTRMSFCRHRRRSPRITVSGAVPM